MDTEKPPRHGLAVRALDLTAAVLASLLRRSIVVEELAGLAAAWDSGLTPILAPRKVLDEIERRGNALFPASWDFTSDSIAALIAAHLGAVSLVLLKSASAPFGAARADASRLGLVDPVLPQATRLIPHVELINLRADPLDRQILQP